MTITSIVPLDRRKSKVFLDEDFALVLYKGEIKKFRLEEGEVMEPDLYREIVDTVLRKRARERALYLLKDGDRTEQDIRGKLKEGCYPEEAIESTLAFLKEYRFLDDERYARQYVLSRVSRKSRRQICCELQQKGIARDTILRLLEENPVEEETQILRFLRKKGYDPNKAEPKEKLKLSAALGRKGFSFEVIKRVMGQDFDRDMF